MPYRDKFQRWCGFLDFEENEVSSHFVRRYFILDTTTSTFKYFMDNPQNLPPGSRPVGSFSLAYIAMVSNAAQLRPKVPFSFYMNVAGRNYYFKANDSSDMMEWVRVLKDAIKITVPVSNSSQGERVDHCVGPSSYETVIIGGVPCRKPIETYSDSDTSSEGRPSEPVRHSKPLMMGYCIKQGGKRKNWKRRYFVLDVGGLSYYKSHTEMAPIKTVGIQLILDVRESIGVHLNRDNLFEVVTEQRVFYIQTDTVEVRTSWIQAIRTCLQAFRKPKKMEVESMQLGGAAGLAGHRQDPPHDVFKG
ncbi:Pleckstrin homology domain-containing family A member 1 [Lamellibrachia satsuma]|nr:Pleckstrin homology domain-containing family A member 1 [Lamellibrachia satsuma]